MFAVATTAKVSLTTHHVTLDELFGQTNTLCKLQQSTCDHGNGKFGYVQV